MKGILSPLWYIEPTDAEPADAEKRLRLCRRHHRIRSFLRAVAGALDRLRDLVDPDLMLCDGVGRFDVLVETHQRVVPGEAAVVEIQNRAANRAESQRFVHHHPERLLLERREILHALVEIGRGQEGLAQFVDRDRPGLRRRLCRAFRSRGGDLRSGIRPARSASTKAPSGAPEWRCACARKLPSNIGRECNAPLDRGSWRVSPFCPVW